MSADLASGTYCFVDSSIFHYAFVDYPGLSARCAQLLNRIDHGDIQACVSVAVAADALHKVMCSEACLRHGRSRSGLVPWLKNHPATVRGLEQPRRALDLLRALPLKVLSVTMSTLDAANEVSHRCGLLTNDAIIVALMQEQGVTHLATNDDDFDDVPEIAIWKPR